jgi:hypothetical protein
MCNLVKLFSILNFTSSAMHHVSCRIAGHNAGSLEKVCHIKHPPARYAARCCMMRPILIIWHMLHVHPNVAKALTCLIFSD